MYVKVLVVSITLFVGQHVARFLWLMDFNKSVFNHKPGPCRLVKGIEHGSEHIYTTPDGLAFITSGIKMQVEGSIMKKYNDDIKLKGRMFLFDFNNPDKDAVELTITGQDFNQSEFFPHGIDGIVHEGKLYLYVVSHPPKQEAIEKFEFVPDKKELKHLRSFKSSVMRLTNDVTVADVDNFYYTKFGHYRSHLGYSLEMGLQLAWGGIFYYNGKSYEEVVDGMLMPNGIQLSNDKKIVYVCLPMVREIRVFRREKNNYLTLINVIPMNTLPDNVVVDQFTGNLLTGNHPITYQIMEHLTYPDKPAPSQVTLIDLDSTRTASDKIIELYADDGFSENSIHASSVATMYNGSMLAGTVRHKLLYCKIDMPLD